MARQTLEGWLNEAMTDNEKENGPSGSNQCHQIVLMHMVGTAQNEIHTLRFGGKVWKASEVASLFQGKADSFAQDLGTESFMLLAFYGGKTEPEARHPFTVEGENKQNGLQTENPTTQGLTMQSMRHSEIAVAQANRHVQFAFQAMQSVTQMLADQNIVLRTENRDFTNIMREMIMEKAANEQANKMKALEYERSSAERKKLLSFVPVLANTLTGKEVFPQSTEDTALIEMIAEKLTGADFAKLGELGIPPELMGALAARGAKHLKQKREAAEEAEKMAQLGPKMDPEDDAAGGMQ